MNTSPYSENTVDNVETWACGAAMRAGRKWGCKVVDLGSELEFQSVGLPVLEPLRVSGLRLVTHTSVELRNFVERRVAAWSYSRVV